MTRFLLAASLSLCAALAQADGIAQLKQFVHDTRALSARFSQTVSGDKPLHVSGTLELQRPGRFRWTYDTPYEQLIVGDGSRLWVYDKGLAQVTARKLDNALGSSPAALLAGNNDLEKHYQLKNQGVSDGLDWLEATPKHSDGTFKSVRMGFKSGELLRMDMEDNFGQHTTLTFSGLQKNPKLPASRFSFTPPKGVDVLAD